MHLLQVENDTILRLAGMQPYEPVTVRTAKPLVDASAQVREFGSPVLFLRGSCRIIWLPELSPSR